MSDPEGLDPTPAPPLRELTVRALVLGVLLSMLLGAANAYLGLKVGMTVSASIPAAVVSMAILAVLRRAREGSQALENNLVQTAASAGESLAAGVIFVIPALVMIGYWETFDFATVTMIAGLGGLLHLLVSFSMIFNDFV